MTNDAVTESPRRGEDRTGLVVWKKKELDEMTRQEIIKAITGKPTFEQCKEVKWE